MCKTPFKQPGPWEGVLPSTNMDGCGGQSGSMVWSGGKVVGIYVSTVKDKSVCANFVCPLLDKLPTPSRKGIYLPALIKSVKHGKC